MAATKAITETTSRSQLQAVIKAARDTMRKDAGLNGDLDRLPQFSWLLFLKAFDERVDQVGEIFHPGEYRPAIPEEFRWKVWGTKRDFSGDELKTFVNEKLIPGLAELHGEDGNPDDPRNVLSTIFANVTNRMQSGTLLRDLVDQVDRISFTSSDDIHTMAFVYETIIKEMRDAAGDSGEFYTPRPVTRFIVQQSFLKFGESILDPACGTGGFLVQAHDELDGAATTETKRKQLHRNLRGIEKKPLPYLLASMNLLLHGVEAPSLVRENALVRMRETTVADRVNVVLTNPPFGGEEEASVVKRFPNGYQTQETSWLFLHSILGQLKQNGRCAIVLPNGSLFAGGIGARIKAKLMKECDLHTIVRLPQGVFAPYTNIPSNLLFFEKGRSTEETWFYEIPLPEGRRGYTKTKPMHFEELKPCIEWWGGEDRKGREQNKYAWKVSAEDIKKADYNLDIPNPHIEDELAHHPPEELANELIKTEEEILNLLKELHRELGGS